MKNIFYFLTTILLLTSCTKENKTLEPEMEVSAVEVGSSLNLGDVPKGKTRLFSIKLENSSDENLTGPVLLTQGTYFSILGGFNCPILKAKSNCTVRLVFDGRSGIVGLIQETLIIGTQTVSLSLTTVPLPPEAPNLQVTPEVSFGRFQKNGKRSATRTIVFTNMGSQPLTGQQASMNFAGGTLLYDICSNREILPTKNCQIKIVLTVREPLLSAETPISGTLNFAGYTVNLKANEDDGTCPSGQYHDGTSCVNIVYEARSFSAYAPVPQVCAGIVNQTRSILSCFRVDTNEQVLNSFCTDSLSSINTPSPAGATTDLNIVGGVQHRACLSGETTPYISSVNCIPGYLNQGNFCIPYNLQVPSTKGFNGTITSIVFLSTGEIVYGGTFDTFTDNDGTIYSLRGVAKFSSSGVINQAFITNVGTNIPSFGGLAIVRDSSDNLYGASNGGTIWKTNSVGVIDDTFKNNTNNKITGVKTLVLDNQGNLILGGYFTNFGGIANNARGLAKLSTDGVFNQTFSDNLDVTPGVKTVNSGITGTLNNTLAVHTLAIDNLGNIYAGGSFYAFKGINYNANKILKLSSNGVFDQAFSDALDVIPGTKATNSGFYIADNTPINKILIDGNTLYVVGAFSHFRGSNFSAMKIAKLTTSGAFDQTFSNNLDVTSGSHTTSSGFNNPVKDIAISNGSLYVVGGFTQFKNIPSNANRIAKLSTSGVFDQAFSDSIDSVVGVKGNGSGFNAGAETIVIKNDSEIFVGGGFDSFKNTSAKFTAKISLSSTLIPFVASSSLFNAPVNDIKQDLDGNTYFVGSFTYYNGKYAPYILKLKPDFEVDETFMQNIGTGFNNALNTIAIDTSGNIFLGGLFTSFNGVANVNRIIKLSSVGVVNSSFMNNLDITPGTKASTSGFNSIVTIIKIGNDGNLYVGGNFQRFKNNPAIKYLTKLSSSGVVSTDFITGYGAGLNNTVYGLGLDFDNNIYVTGTFTAFGGVSNNANGLAKFSSGGLFNQSFSDNLDEIAGVKTSTSGFFVSAGINQGQAILVEDNMLFLGSSFGKFKNENLISRGLAKFSLDGVFDHSFKTTMGNGFGPSATILSIDTDGEHLYLAGSFSLWNGVSHAAKGIAKLSFDGQLNQSFMDHLNADYIDSANPGTPSANSGFDSIVQTISIGVHGEVLIGGQFNEFKNLKYERAVILNADGTLPVSF